MKPYSVLFACLMSLLMTLPFSSCKKDDPDSLEVSPSEISVSSEKETRSITITANTDWVIKNLPSWIEAIPSSGKGNATVNLAIMENTGIEERSTTIIVSTKAETVSKVINVKQSGLNIKIEVDVTSINLLSSANSSQLINIKCNSAWSVNGVPDWLQVSSLAGNGNSTISVTTRSENDTATPRSCTLLITSNGQTQSVFVQQEAALNTCKVTPSNITTLYYAVIFNLTYTPDVATTKISLISDYDYKHKTEREIIAMVEGESANIPEDETIYTRAVDPDTKYHIVSLAYDKKGNRGELVDTEFSSPVYMNATDDAWCTFEDAGFTSSSFIFTVLKQGRCNTYDLIYGANFPANYVNGPLMAFEINYYNLNRKKNWLSEQLGLRIETSYPNNHTFSCPFHNIEGYNCVIASTWGMFADGTHSSDISTVTGVPTANSMMSKNKKNDKETEAVEWLRSQNDWVIITPKNFIQ